MNIAAHGPVIAFVLDHFRAVTPLEQVADAPPTAPRPDCKAGKKALHACAEVGARRLEQEMEMVSHDDVTEHLPAVADDRLLQAVDQPVPVRIIADDLLPGIAPRHHMIDGVLKFDPQSPWHVQTLRAGSRRVKLKNKKPSLSPRTREVCHRERARQIGMRRRLVGRSYFTALSPSWSSGAARVSMSSHLPVLTLKT